MTTRIYLAIGLCLAVDWILLMGVNRMNGHAYKPILTLAGASISAVYTWLCLNPDFSFLGGMHWRLIILVLIGLLAFELSVKKTVQFVLTEMALYGLTSNSPSAGHLMLSVAIIIILLLLAFRGKKEPECVPVQIVHDNQVTEIKALCDSGNLLKDPITGLPVLVVSATLSERLIGVPSHELCDPLVCMSRRRGLRLIPYHAVGSTGMLIAKRFENVTLNGIKAPRVLAFSPNEIGAGKQFCALTGGI